jgi:hypothetical protein
MTDIVLFEPLPLPELEEPIVLPLAWPPPVLPTNRTDATAQLATHPADHNAVNQAMNDVVPVVAQNISQINALYANAGWLNDRINDLVNRKPVVYNASNDNGIGTVAQSWTNFQCGTFNLPYAYTYDCQIMVACGLNAIEGGPTYLIGGIDGIMSNASRGGSTTLKGSTVQLVHTFSWALNGPSQHNVHLWGWTETPGTMGRALVQVLAVPR